MKMAENGVRATNVQRQKALLAQLEAEKRDKAVAQKALIAQRQAADVMVDPLTNEAFKEIRITLTQADFTLGLNAAGQTTVIATYTVPNGINLYFRGVKSEVDRNAPYLYGTIQDVAAAPLQGTLRVRIYDATLNDLKGQPFTGSIAQVNAAAPVNWFERLFFNGVKPVRAHAGDKVVIDINSATVWDPATSFFSLHVIQLTKQY